MRYDYKVLSLVFLTLSTLLLSGCGANVCAFGHIGECKNTLQPRDQNNGLGVTNGQIIIEPTASEVRVGGPPLLIKYRGVQQARIFATIGQIQNQTATTFELFVPAGSGGAGQTSRITIKTADYKEEYAETAVQNRGKFAKASIEVIN